MKTPCRDPERMRREVARMLNRQILGIDKRPNEPDETADLAILI